VEAPDWSPAPHCGEGLHGFLNGCGNGALADWNESAKWLIIEVDSEVLIDLKGKVKFPRGEVAFCGDRLGAIAKLEALAPETKHMPVIGAIRVAGANMQCHAGDRGTATAGVEGTATAGYRGDATAGDYGTATAGDYGTATAGYFGKAIAEDYGTATAGERGTATAGYRGTATAGAGGTATAGDGGKVTAGGEGKISINWWDEKAKRLRTTIGYVGEDNIQANIPYQCDKEGKLIPAGSSDPPTE